MNLDKLKQDAKKLAKDNAPAIAGITTAAIAASVVTGMIMHRHYNPKGMLAMQCPEGMLQRMVAEGKGVAFNDKNFGWFVIMHAPDYVPNAVRAAAEV